ncbi:acyltransferase [Ligilactobacillus salivarius]|nr:acyltransferase [Ligilactobacillus salivarius]
MSKRIDRNSSLELLRIISMLFIVMNHYSGEEPWNMKGASLVNVISYQLYKPLGQVGVDIFVLITGYFLASKVDANYTISMKRASKVWLEVWFYSVVVFFAGSFYYGHFSIANMVKGFLPIVFNNYWFATAYIILVLLAPFINKLLEKLSKREYIVLLIITIFCGEVIPVIGNTTFSLDKGFGDILAVYLVGGYIRRYDIVTKKFYLIFVVIATYLLMLVSILILWKIVGYEGNITRFTYGILPFTMAISIFLIFVEIPSFTNKTINWFASSVFATYLMTENIYADKFIWTELFNTTSYENPLLISGFGLLIAVFLVIITVFVDKFRILLFNHLKLERRIYRIIDKIVF